ncbi:MAG: FHA domain-containing protein [Methylococcales bacterium]|jgi:hypothetical protein|nr:FHA domain-containing protein [Methylococcales bacterium]MBT7444201.1 FHA domain-containing protein [Methylococcales bacterium]
MDWIINILNAGVPAWFALVGAVTSIGLFVLLIRLIKKLGSYREQWQESREELGQKQNDREQFFISTQAQITRMQTKMHELTEHAFIEQFETDELYTLMEKQETTFRGSSYYYGLVKRHDNTLVPYLVKVAEASGLEDLASGDQFSLFSNRLAGVVPFQENGSPIIQFPHTSRRKKPDFAFEMAEEYYESLPFLKVISGPDIGAVYYLPFTTCNIGRAKENTILLSDELVSDVHAKLRYEYHIFIILLKDTGANLLHNDQKIVRKPLNFGDTLTLGGTKMQFSCKGFDLRETDPVEAIEMFRTCLQREPNFIIALKNLAFLLERDIRFKKESDPIWQRLSRLERRVSS